MKALPAGRGSARRAFEVYLNGKRLCVAGVGDEGVLNTVIDYVAGKGRNELHLLVGGLIGPAGEHVVWTRRRLKRGDEVRVQIVDAALVDRPGERRRRDPKQDVEAQEHYVRQMARKLGWEVRTSRRSP